jgi:hypothetical protein
MNDTSQRQGGGERNVRTRELEALRLFADRALRQEIVRQFCLSPRLS